MCACCASWSAANSSAPCLPGAPVGVVCYMHMHMHMHMHEHMHMHMHMHMHALVAVVCYMHKGAS